MAHVSDKNMISKKSICSLVLLWPFVCQAIINGETLGTQEARKLEPFAVYLSGYHYEPGKKTETKFCGSTLINDRYLVSAAHCIYNTYALGKKEPKKIPLKVSLIKLCDTPSSCEKDRKKFKIHRIVEPPEPYQIKKPHTHDLVLLVLEKPVTNTPVTLVEPHTILDGKTLMAIGWGLKNLTDKSDDLVTAPRPIGRGF